MQKDKEKTIVIFRKWKKSISKDQGIIALFPFETHFKGQSEHAMSYEHVGQHGGCNYRLCVKNSKLATAEEYADLKAELESLGYNLKIAKRKLLSMIA